MIQIISSTDRPGSRTLEVAKYVAKLYEELKVPCELMDLAKLDLKDAVGGDYYKGAQGTFKAAVEKINQADGCVFLVPEYNGSYPGILKLFVDYWQYPKTFENRPMAFIGLGTRWGGLRAVEHLQQAFGYRNAFIFPHRLFIANVKDNFQNGEFKDQMMLDVLKTQTREFIKYMRGLRSESLDACGRKNP